MELYNSKPLISIIVPVYNVERYLKRCVQSVQSQKYSKWELFLIDDGSSDNCPQICDELASYDDRIKVIHKENEGQAVARNIALDKAGGNYIFFLDSDDYIHTDALFDMLEVAQLYNADIVQCTFIRGNDNKFPPITKTKKCKVFTNSTIFYSRIQKCIVWGKLYRRELWNGVRMPAGKLNYEDDATTWKLYYRSRKIVFLDTPYFYYFDNPNSTMAIQCKEVSLSYISVYEERISFFEQKGDKLLTDISKWRYCLPLMLTYMRGNVKKQDLPILLEHFYKYYRAAICCRKVHAEHRVLIAVFSCYPRLFRKFFELTGKAHTL